MPFQNVKLQPRTDCLATRFPLFMFVFLFGISMDYHVFILSRIRAVVPRLPAPRP